MGRDQREPNYVGQDVGCPRVRCAGVNKHNSLSNYWIFSCFSATRKTTKLKIRRQSLRSDCRSCLVTGGKSKRHGSSQRSNSRSRRSRGILPEACVKREKKPRRTCEDSNRFFRRASRLGLSHGRSHVQVPKAIIDSLDPRVFGFQKRSFSKSSNRKQGFPTLRSHQIAWPLVQGGL